MTNQLTFVPKSAETAKYQCGHDGPAKFVWKLGEHEIELRDKFWELRPFCPECGVKKCQRAFVLCVQCRQVIGPGDSVAYGSIADAPPGPMCLRQGCAPGIAITGRWTEQGYEAMRITSQEGGILRMGYPPR